MNRSNYIFTNNNNGLYISNYLCKNYYLDKSYNKVNNENNIDSKKLKRLNNYNYINIENIKHNFKYESNNECKNIYELTNKNNNNNNNNYSNKLDSKDSNLLPNIYPDNQRVLSNISDFRKKVNVIINDFYSNTKLNSNEKLYNRILHMKNKLKYIKSTSENENSLRYGNNISNFNNMCLNIRHNLKKTSDLQTKLLESIGLNDEEKKIIYDFNKNYYKKLNNNNIIDVNNKDIDSNNNVEIYSEEYKKQIEDLKQEAFKSSTIVNRKNLNNKMNLINKELKENLNYIHKLHEMSYSKVKYNIKSIKPFKTYEKIKNEEVLANISLKENLQSKIRNQNHKSVLKIIDDKDNKNINLLNNSNLFYKSSFKIFECKLQYELFQNNDVIEKYINNKPIDMDYIYGKIKMHNLNNYKLDKKHIFKHNNISRLKTYIRVIMFVVKSPKFKEEVNKQITLSNLDLIISFYFNYSKATLPNYIEDKLPEFNNKDSNIIQLINFYVSNSILNSILNIQDNVEPFNLKLNKNNLELYNKGIVNIFEDLSNNIKKLDLNVKRFLKFISSNNSVVPYKLYSKYEISKIDYIAKGFRSEIYNIDIYVKRIIYSFQLIFPGLNYFIDSNNYLSIKVLYSLIYSLLVNYFNKYTKYIDYDNYKNDGNINFKINLTQKLSNDVTIINNSNDILEKMTYSYNATDFNKFNVDYYKSYNKNIKPLKTSYEKNKYFELNPHIFELGNNLDYKVNNNSLLFLDLNNSNNILYSKYYTDLYFKYKKSNNLYSELVQEKIETINLMISKCSNIEKHNYFEVNDANNNSSNINEIASIKNDFINTKDYQRFIVNHKFFKFFFNQDKKVLNNILNSVIFYLDLIIEYIEDYNN